MQHGIYAYYGRLGQGKTYAMVADILDALRKGHVVYTNLPLKWDGYDETNDSRAWFRIFLSMCGVPVSFRVCASTNLRYIEVDENFQSTLAGLTDCIVALDEAYAAFDSYEMAKMTLRARQNVLHTRHFNRSIWYTVQRPTNIHVVMRGVTNVFYKCRRIFALGRFILFVRDEHDLGATETVNDDERLSRRWYLGSKRVYDAYNTTYLRPDGFSSLPASVKDIRVSRGYFWKKYARSLFYSMKKAVRVGRVRP